MPSPQGRHGQSLEIVDRQGLETVACECYRVIKDELDKVGLNA